MEIIKIILLFIISVEGALLLYDKKEIVKKDMQSRRELTGKFKDPLGYKTNTRGQLRPIIPGGKMIDEEDDI